MDLGYFKRHPWITAGVVVVGGVVFFTIFNGGGGGASAAPNAGVSAADQQYRLAQLQGNIASMGYEARLEEAKLESATMIELATFQFDLEALKAGIQETLGLAAIDVQQGMIESQLEAVKIQTQAATQQHALDLANQSEARQQSIQLSALQMARESEREAWDYTLNYQRNQQAYDIQQGMLALLNKQAA